MRRCQRRPSAVRRRSSKGRTPKTTKSSASSTPIVWRNAQRQLRGVGVCESSAQAPGEPDINLTRGTAVTVAGEPCRCEFRRRPTGGEVCLSPATVSPTPAPRARWDYAGPRDAHQPCTPRHKLTRADIPGAAPQYACAVKYWRLTRHRLRRVGRRGARCASPGIGPYTVRMTRWRLRTLALVDTGICSRRSASSKARYCPMVTVRIGATPRACPASCTRNVGLIRGVSLSKRRIPRARRGGRGARAHRGAPSR